MPVNDLIPDMISAMERNKSQERGEVVMGEGGGICNFKLGGQGHLTKQMWRR